MDPKLLQISADKLIASTKNLITVNQILTTDFGPELWDIERLIPQKSITAITGMPMSFKTWLALDIARCVAQENNFLGQFKTEKGKVLVIDKENHIRHIQKRLKMLGIGDDQIYYFEKAEDFLIDNEKHFKIVMDIVQKLKIKIVIFDSLVRIHSGDENESKDISRVMNLFRKITSAGATVIFIHHNRKENGKTQNPNSVRGSSDIFAGVDCLIQISRPEKNKLRVSQSKLRQGEELPPFKVNIVVDDKNSMKFEYDGKDDSDSPAIEEVAEEILELLKDGSEKTRREIIKALPEEYGTSIIDEALKLLTGTKIEKKVGAHNKFSFTIRKEQG